MTSDFPWGSLIWLAAGGLIGLVLAGMRAWWRARPSEPSADRQRAYSALDTVIAWQPDRVRVLNRQERRILEALEEALPEYTVLAKLPLARFIRVPRRNSFNEWLNRVGYLNADFVVCDKATDVIAVVQLRTDKPSDRSQRRQARMKRVLSASGVRFVVWAAGEPPPSAMIRERVLPGFGADTVPGADSVPPLIFDGAQADIPLPEIDEIEDEAGRRREPPSSTWYSDLDSISPRRGGGDDERRR
jgi:hypothetical protein